MKKVLVPVIVLLAVLLANPSFALFDSKFEAETTKEKQGWFARKFSSKKQAENTPHQYQIAVRSEGASSQVLVLNAQGQPETTKAAQNIVRVLAEDLK